jgi:hypothetical protein
MITPVSIGEMSLLRESKGIGHIESNSRAWMVWIGLSLDRAWILASAVRGGIS